MPYTTVLQQNVIFYCKGGRTPDAKRSAASRRTMSFKFEHIVFYVCTHTGGVIRVCPQRPATTQNTVQIPAAPQSAICIVLY